MEERNTIDAVRPCRDPGIDILARQAIAEAGRVAGALGAVEPSNPDGDPEALERSARVLDRLSGKTLEATVLAPDQAVEISQIFMAAAQLVRDRDPLAMACALNRAASVCIGTCARYPDGQ